VTDNPDSTSDCLTTKSTRWNWRCAVAIQGVTQDVSRRASFAAMRNQSEEHVADGQHAESESTVDHSEIGLSLRSSWVRAAGSRVSRHDAPPLAGWDCQLRELQWLVIRR
jgi:hypothetical protein